LLFELSYSLRYVEGGLFFFFWKPEGGLFC
jgi:hypothetical protein